MTALTAGDITVELEEAFREADIHGNGCRCCEAVDSPWQRLYGEAFYAVDRYRPSESITDETDESIDALVEQIVAASVVAIRETITRMAADALAGKVFVP